jgi:hypothetical protein
MFTEPDLNEVEDTAMKTNSYTREPIAGIREDGKAVMPASESHRLQKLEEEIKRLKKQVANLTRDNKMLREIALSHW